MGSYERKVTKIGNGFGVTFPNELLKEAGLEHGDLVQLEVKNNKIILGKKEDVTLPEGVDAEFMDILNEVTKMHDKALKGLVNR